MTVAINPINLISECCLEEKGCTIESSKTNRTIYDKYGNVAFIANRHNKLNKLNCKIVIPIKDTITKDKQDQSLAVSSTIKSSKTNRTIYDKYGNVALTANRHNNFNKLNRKMVIPIKGTIIKYKQDQSLAVSSTFKSPATISVWNQRLGHLSDSGIQTLTKRAQGLDIIPNKQGEPIKSEPCISGKAHRASFPTQSDTTFTKVNQLLQTNVAEPMNVASANHIEQVKTETIIPVKANRLTMAANSSLETLTPFSLQKKYLDNSRLHTLHNRLEQQSARIKLLWVLHALC
ncbi:hypothetical protein BASA62_002858 [Batrachochytrium salamandrivorans]|nr:hypothetical protein BASA62_002858 [Batrachochytrium salamandrivorans]